MNGVKTFSLLQSGIISFSFLKNHCFPPEYKSENSSKNKCSSPKISFSYIYIIFFTFKMNFYFYSSIKQQHNFLNDSYNNIKHVFYRIEMDLLSHSIVPLKKVVLQFQNKYFALIITGVLCSISFWVRNSRTIVLLFFKRKLEAL